MIFKLKIVQPGVEVLKVFRKGLKLVEYCKTCKNFIADSEIVKKRYKDRR